MKREPLFILNFNDRLDEVLKEEIAATLGREVIEKRIRIAINSQKLAYPQVLVAMDAVDLKNLPDEVVVNLPRLPIAAVYIVNEFYARTGTYPLIIELIRDFTNPSVRRFCMLRNLELEVEATRRRRPGHLTAKVLENLPEKLVE